MSPAAIPENVPEIWVLRGQNRTGFTRSIARRNIAGNVTYTWVGCRGSAKHRGGINRRGGTFDRSGGRRSLNWLRPYRGGYAAISKAAISVAADLRDTLAAGAGGAS